jgi:hypothetical protein
VTHLLRVSRTSPLLGVITYRPGPRRLGPFRARRPVA